MNNADIQQGASRASKRPQTSGKVRSQRANGRRHPAKCEASEQTAADIRQSARRASKRPQTSGKMRGERANGRRNPTKCTESEQTAADIRQRAKKESKRPQTSARGEPRKRGSLEVDLKSNELTASDPNLNLIAIWVGTTNSEPLDPRMSE